MTLQEKFKQYRKWIQENKSREYTIFLCTVFLLFTVLLTSKLWLPSDVKIQNSDIGSEKNVTGSVSLILDSWQYNKTANYMEASFTIEGLDGTEDYKFVPTAHTNTNKTQSLDAIVAYSSTDLLTIQISNIPSSKKWQVISLWIKGNDVFDNEESIISSDDSDTLQGANFFCDSRKVVINNSLEPQSELNYALQSIYNQMTAIKADITEQNTDISTANAQIDQLNFDISSLKADQEYETTDELQKSNSSIQSKNSQIDNLKNQILIYQSQISTDQEKLKKLNQKLDDTKSGKLSVSSDLNSEMSSAPVSSSVKSELKD